MHTRRATSIGLVAVVALGASCGDSGERGTDGTVASPPPATTSATTTTVATAPTNTATTTSVTMTEAPATGAPEPSRLSGAVIAKGQTMTAPRSWWFVVDLAGGDAVAGSSRVAVEIPSDEVGCGERDLPYGAWRIEDGATVSFEPLEGPPGAVPDMWFPPDGPPSPLGPAVRGGQLRAECPPGAEAVADDLAAQRAVWERARPADYTFTLTWHVFNELSGNYRIHVVDGAAVSIQRDGSSYEPEQLEGNLPRTIDEIFDQLERHVSADRFTARYDPSLGFPVTVEVDEMSNAMDDELEVRVGNLEAGAAGPPAGG